MKKHTSYRIIQQPKKDFYQSVQWYYLQYKTFWGWKTVQQYEYDGEYIDKRFPTMENAKSHAYALESEKEAKKRNDGIEDILVVEMFLL